MSGLVELSAADKGGPGKGAWQETRQILPEEEPNLPAAMQQKMDEGERNELAKADKKYTAKAFKEAVPLYDVYLASFPKGVAVPYAILKKGRAMMLQLHRKQAIVTFQEILDYFPNQVEMAAFAVYFQGQAHFLNGDDGEAVKVWSMLARDEGYRTQPIAAFALVRLADYLVSQGKAPQAVPYLWQIAIDFRGTNPRAAHSAIQKVVAHHTRTAIAEPKLREFWLLTKGWGDRPVAVEPDAKIDRAYWWAVVGSVRAQGNFPADQAELCKRYFATWVELLDNRFADWDDYQLALADFRLNADGDRKKWLARLVDQYQRGQKPGDYDRTLRWLQLVAVDKESARFYFSKLDQGKMSYAQVRRLLDLLYQQVKEPELGRAVSERIDPATLNDDQRADLTAFYWRVNEEAAGLRINAMISDGDKATFQRLEYFAGLIGKKDGAKYLDLVIAAADALNKNPAYAQKAAMTKGNCLFKSKKYPEAIVAFRQADLPPTSIFKISECLVADGKIPQAVQELHDLEALFPTGKAKAAQGVASIYINAKQRENAIAELRRIMATYPKTPESSWAHERLEGFGVRIKGGSEAE